MSDAASNYDKGIRQIYTQVQRMIQQELLKLFGKNLRAGRLDASVIAGGSLSVGTVTITSGTTTGVAPGAGGAGALPATPAGYLTVSINGTNRQIPYY